MKQILSRGTKFRNTLCAPALIAALIASGCSALPEKRIHTAIEIGAPAERVWSILVDNEAYPDWNPYHVSVRGRMQVGEKLEVRINKPNGERVEIEPRVMRIQPYRELTWGGGVRGIFHGEHVFLLEEIDAANTRLVHREKFTGIAVPFASLDSIEDGYRQMNHALKIRAEMQ
jgi:hypothetical protein